MCKAERLSSKAVIDKLFSGASKSFAIYPLRVVYMAVERKEDVYASILISVPKKRFKRAVKRNRVKRQVREAYRKNKHSLLNALAGKDYGLAISFIYLDNKLIPSVEVEEKVKSLLARVTEKLE